MQNNEKETRRVVPSPTRSTNESPLLRERYETSISETWAVAAPFTRNRNTLVLGLDAAPAGLAVVDAGLLLVVAAGRTGEDVADAGEGLRGAATPGLAGEETLEPGAGFTAMAGLVVPAAGLDVGFVAVAVAGLAVDDVGRAVVDAGLVPVVPAAGLDVGFVAVAVAVVTREGTVRTAGTGLTPAAAVEAVGRGAAGRVVVAPAAPAVGLVVVGLAAVDVAAGFTDAGFTSRMRRQCQRKKCGCLPAWRKRKSTCCGRSGPGGGLHRRSSSLFFHCARYR